MTDLHFLAYYHGHGGGMADWIAHTAVSSVIHAVIYGTVFRVMHQLTISQAVVLAIVVIACFFMWGRTRDRRG